MQTWSNEEEAERLAKRFVGVSQADFARRFHVRGGASMVSQHIKKRRPLNLAAAIAYARGFNVGLEDISPRLALEAKQATHALTAHAQAVATATANLTTYPGPQSLAAALETLGIALAANMPDDVRDDVADALAKLARRRGADRDQVAVAALLTAGASKLPRTGT